MSNYRILVVEDEESIRTMYAFKLKTRPNFTVETAENGKLGLELAESMKPDIILLDLMMPEMTGDRMLELLRQKEWGGSIRVIVLTNVSRSEAPSRLRFLNVDRYVVKAHSTPTEVLKQIDEVLGIKN